MDAAPGVQASPARVLVRQLATLVHSAWPPAEPALVQQALVWWQALGRAGLEVPLVAVADVGRVLAGHAPAQGPGPVFPSDDTLARYHTLVHALSERHVTGALIRDEIIAAELGRLFGDAFRRSSGGRASGAGDVLPEGDLAALAALLARPAAELAHESDTRWALPFLRALGERAGAVLLRFEQFDLRLSRLLGMMPAGAAMPDVTGLMQLAANPAAAESVGLALELMPSLLETRREESAQRFAVGGYASIESRGSLHTLLPSELAHDDDVFFAKVLSHEVLHHQYERPSENPRREHWILIDGSASMRGVREVFARALALALGRTLGFKGGEVVLRFFDSRLHRRVPLGAAWGRDLPYVLGHRSERGRNYARVFSELLTEVVRRPADRALAITVFTHADFVVPLDVMQALVARAHVGAVLLFPSHEGQLPCAHLLHTVQVITPESLRGVDERRHRALEVIRALA